MTSRLGDLLQDLRHAARRLRRSPGYTAVVVWTMGLGIAANTVVFSLLNPYFLRPLPYGEPEDLVQVHQVDGVTGWDQARHSLAQAEDWASRARSLEETAVYRYGTVNLTGAGGAERVGSAVISANLLDVLRVQPVRGRGFLPDEEGPDAPPVVLLDHGVWTRRYGADPALVGGTVRLDGVPHTVVGIMPPGFRFPYGEVKVWTSLRTNATAEARDRTQWIVLARLAPGWTPERAGGELTGVQSELAAAHPDTDAGYRGANVLPLRRALNFAWDPLRLAFTVLVAAMGFVLLVTCLNVAALTLARVSGRTGEVAVRAALGAGRGRIVRQLFGEGVLLAVAGGALGVGLSLLVMDVVGPLLPEAIFRVGEMSVDGRVLAFTAALTLVAPFLFALPPAITASRTDLAPALRAAGRSGWEGPRTLVGRRLLVVGQVALATVLVAGAGLMVRSLERVESLDLGFRDERVLVADVSLASATYGEEDRIHAFYEEARSGVGALPGVAGAATVYPLPLNHETMTTRFAVPGRTPAEADAWPVGIWYRTSPGYFRTMGIPILVGRDFGPGDGPDGSPVVVVNRTLAERWWGDAAPVGSTMLVGDGDEAIEATVVGVAGDVLHQGLSEPPAPQIYLPAAQRPLARQFVVAFVEGDPASAVPAVRETLAALDPDISAQIRPMGAVVAESTFLWTIPSMVLSAFGVGALLLAALGLYGVIAYSVARRGREIGIRMALGADARDLRRGVVLEGLRLAGIGLAAGLLLAWVAGRLLSSVLFGVSPHDPLALGGTALLFAAVAGAASFLPAFRASRVDPTTVLRME